jgi:hypothetical protein
MKRSRKKKREVKTGAFDVKIMDISIVHGQDKVDRVFQMLGTNKMSKNTCGCHLVTSEVFGMWC